MARCAPQLSVVLVAAVSAVGCGFDVSGRASDGGPGDSGGHDSPDDANVDEGEDMGTPSCIDRWVAHTIRFDEPVPVDGVNTPALERDPWLDADETELYLSSERTNGDDPPPGGADIHRFVKLPSGSWAAMGPYAPLSSGGYDSKISMDASRTIAVVVSDAGTAGSDVWMATRPNANANWGSLSKALLAAVNTPAADYDAFLTADGRSLYWAPQGVVSQDLAVATRSGTDMPFSAGTPLEPLNSDAGDADPATSIDQRVLVFASNRTGNDIWYATRATTTDDFTLVGAVPDVNSGQADGDPHLSADGCRLYFARNQEGNDWDIYVATATAN